MKILLEKQKKLITDNFLYSEKNSKKEEIKSEKNERKMHLDNIFNERNLYSAKNYRNLNEMTKYSVSKNQLFIVSYKDNKNNKNPDFKAFSNEFFFQKGKNINNKAQQIFITEKKPLNQLEEEKSTANKTKLFSTMNIIRNNSLKVFSSEKLEKNKIRIKSQIEKKSSFDNSSSSSENNQQSIKNLGVFKKVKLIL